MVTSPKNSTIKFLCSYGGKIVPRYPDGKLRYNGGHTRVLSFNRSVSFSELATKMTEMCGSTVAIRCQLPTEDFDALVSVTSDEDLSNLIEEYDLVSSSSPSPLKIRVFLNPPKTKQKPTISPTPLTLPSYTSSTSTVSSTSSSPRSPSLSKPPLPPSPPTTAKNQCYGCYIHRNSRSNYLVHNGNHWQ